MKTPFWQGYCADPFIYSSNNRYYAVGTGRGGGTFLERTPEELKHKTAASEADKAIPLLVSDDLKQWRYVGGVLRPLVREETVSYWAPEVIEHQGVFYLYYSAGGPEGEGHQIRLAVSRHPEGVFEDTGKRLLPKEPFSIDVHPFCDPKDGRWYLFFAKDFFDEPAGTGIAVCPLRPDLGGIAGDPVTVVRATEGWQVFAENRFWYGKLWPKWHTVEGPAVWFHEGRYYCFYSGGNWHTPGYGITYAVANDAMGPYEPVRGPAPVLEGGDDMRGPGHCSFFRGEGGEVLMAFHAWDREERVRRPWMGGVVWDGGRPWVD